MTLLIAAATLLLVVLRPRGWHEAWWTVAGASLMLACGLVTPAQAAGTLHAGLNVLLFLLALLVLTALVEESGFFDWAAVGCARMARGQARLLFANVFVLGAIVTAALSLDTTAVMLTPVVLAGVARLRLPPMPYVLLCAMIANIGSSLLPISNLTNLLLADTLHVSFARFVGVMAAPQLTGLFVQYGIFRWWFRADLAATFDPAVLPRAHEVIREPRYFRVTCAVLAVVCVGYFAGPAFGLAPYVVAFAGAAVLAAAHAFLLGRPSWARRVSLAVFPFVIGLFIVVRAVENLGIVAWLAARVPTDTPWHAIVTSAATAAVGANAINNLPAALLAREVLRAAPMGAWYGALLGSNIGPCLTLYGSLATLLVVQAARKENVRVSGWEFFKLGAVLMPAVLLASCAALWLVLGT